MSRVVVVSSYPPRHCGIGAYAAVQVERLRAEGHEVVVVSPPDGEGDVRVPFFGGRPFREAERISRRGDRVLVHFQPALYYRPRAPVSKVATSLRLWRLCRRRGTEILVHEADRPIRWRPDYALLRRAFAAAPTLLFHTARERDRLEEWYRVHTRSRLVDHREGIRPVARPNRAEARHALGLPEDETVFVSPGFLHPDKGYERAMHALGGAGRLFVVGSVKDRAPANLAYAERLRRLAAETAGVELVERYLGEEELDRWVAAADAVVLPYRRSWSSGALARAQALGVPAIVTDVGGLAEQAGRNDVVVRDDRALAEALRRVSARGVVPR
ncbi:MAG TPA: glycosyltransferase [Actinomycetota bacterium]|nr:glycosyltransferase [Actinomycetota bacterium]